MATSYPNSTVEGKTFLGHPRGLFVLFFAEMWERFSYYGMRAILIFYLLQHWLFAEDKAYGIYGAYTALVYITPVIGGYLADRYIGQRKAVQFGAVLLTIGHGLMAFEGTGGQDSPYLNVFWLALAFIIMGVGFLKANISAIVGQLYGQGDPRRDPAFTIFYMGINLGAATGSLLVAYLGQTYGWAWGFGAAGIGMLLGLIVFVWGRASLLGRGEAPDAAALKRPVMGIPLEWMVYLSGFVGIAVVWALIQYQDLVGWLLALFGAAVVIFLLFTAVAKLDKVDRDRIFAALFLIALQPLFWALFEQAGSSLNVYTDEQVNREIFGWDVPAGMFQSINAIYIVLLGPVFAGLWLWLNRRGWEPSTPAKFGIGIIQLGAGFLVLVAGAAAAGAGLTPVIFIFLIYLLHTTGELCLSPVGLSAMTKLAPARMVSLIMGTWFLASAGGNYIGGMIAQATGGEGAAEAASATQVMDVYSTIGWIAVGVGVAVILVSPLVKKLMHEDVDNEHHDRVLAGQREIGEPAAAGIRTDEETKPGVNSLMRALLGGAALLALAACADTSARTASSDSPRERVAFSADPYPSTYRAYPGEPTLVTNVTIYDGEGGRIDNGSILFAEGKVVEVGQGIAAPAGATVIDGAGKWVTPGIIDVHSHLGNYPSPAVEAHSDGNEVTNPVHPDVWAEHAVWPQDPGFSRALANGGVTSLQILPGSADLFGGRSVTLKNVPARTMQAMKFPGAPQGLKMACGENPKRVYGNRNQMPGSRMGNVALNRATWAKAVEYDRDWDKYEEDGGNAPDRNIGMDTLRGVLSGDILVHNHCYRADEMAVVIDMAKEFGYQVAAFHHAVESYKIADLLAENEVCSAMWSDWWGFKMEAYDGIPENIPLVHNAGACAIVHSDDPNGIQRLNQEAAKALADGRRMGIAIPDEVAWTWLSYNPARAMGVADFTGSLKPGKMADVVLWNGDPLSVYTRPEKVWVDGALLYDALDARRRPVSDFELGQPGEGDVK